MKYPLVVHPLEEYNDDGLQTQLYLSNLKDFLKEQKPLNNSNLEDFLKIHHKLFLKNGVQIKQCFSDGKLYLDNEVVGSWDGKLTHYLGMGGSAESFSTFICPDCYKNIRQKRMTQQMQEVFSKTYRDVIEYPERLQAHI